MNSKKIELLTLVVGSLSIFAAIYFGFFDASSVYSGKITNYIFSGAFLIFITYTYIKSSEYEKIKKQLSDEISNLNDRVNQLTNEIEEKSQVILRLNTDIDKKNQLIKKIENENKNLSEKITRLEEIVDELSQKIKNTAAE
ncbi:MAG: hypothetical protein ACK4KT_07835 [Thermaurantimonas sp.]